MGKRMSWQTRKELLEAVRLRYRPPLEVLTYLWVLVMVTFVAEATGTVRIIVADHRKPYMGYY